VNPLPIGSAVAFESGALALALLRDPSLGVYYSFLGLHALASALFVLVLYPLLPLRFQRPRLTVLLLCFALAFFMPFFGLLALWVAVLVMRWLPQHGVRAPFRLAGTPELPQIARAEGRRFRELSVRPLLADARLAPTLRAPALNALSTMPLRVVGELLHRLLGDPVEEMRLVAYGLLDNREKELRHRIGEQAAALAAIDTAGAGVGAATLHALHLRAMVELHFELVYQRLVQGDLRDLALEQALSYAARAIELAGPEAGLLQLRARVYLEAGYLARAQDDLEQAAVLGAPPVRVLPYLAEVAYLQGDWAAVRGLLQPLQGLPVTPRLAALRRYWCGPEAD
jgi:polysaccharide biosynthesis protein PelE